MFKIMALLCLLNPENEIIYESCIVRTPDEVFQSEQECIEFKTAADLRSNKDYVGQATVVQSECEPVGEDI